jgi:hypothetical protein
MPEYFRVFLLSLALTGFASWADAQAFTKPTAEQAIPAPAPDKAQIVFIRATGAMIYSFLSILYEVGPDKDLLISPMKNKSKVVHEVAPGEHVFLSHGPIWAHFMKANVEAGKRYYVLVRAVHGRGFQLRPMRKDGTTDYNTSVPQFAEWLRDTERVEAGEAFEPYMTKFQKNLDEVRAKGFEEWKTKTPAQLAELTLNPADGFDP